MPDLQRLSDVQVLLLAARFISDVNVDSLQILAAERKDVLTEDIVYRLLLTLYPADETARSALLALLQSIRTSYSNVSSLDATLDTSFVDSLSPNTAIQEARHLHLSSFHNVDCVQSTNPSTKFLVSWSHYVESRGGSLQDALALVQGVSEDDIELAHWSRSFLAPLVRLQYEFYPEREERISLREMESMTGLNGVKTLLQPAESGLSQSNIARDLEFVVAPWIGGSSAAHHTADWTDAFEWFLHTSTRDFSAAANAMLDWSGPPNADEDVAHKMSQTGFALIYAKAEGVKDDLQTLWALWKSSTVKAGIIPVSQATDEPDIAYHTSEMNNVPDSNFSAESFLLRDNELTKVSPASSALLAGVLKTAEILNRYKLDTTLLSIARICISMSATENRQKLELSRILQQIPRLTSSEPNWELIRRQILWLHAWKSPLESGVDNASAVAYLGHLKADFIEAELLAAMLNSGQYTAAKDLYLASPLQPLDPSVVEEHVVRAIYSSYDNASNGNRNRGGVKRASDILSTFRASFPESTEFVAIDHLLRATHSLSFYQLTLQHGVPFRPANLRAQKDPLNLVEKVLEQDPITYSKLDDLIEVGRNLLLSRAESETLPSPTASETKPLEAEHRVTFLAISSALANHDFDTAYSYITTRLLHSRASQAPDGFVDDTSWRAAYAAGRYRPPSSPSALHARISNLSKRMELLSLALTLAPGAEHLSEILGTWRRCEEEMDNLKSTALDEEREFDMQGSAELPGGFGMDDREKDVAETRKAVARRTLMDGSATYEEEAPIGLFEMAKGAASSLRKNAFPLNATSGQGIRIHGGEGRSSSDLEEHSGTGQESDRVRKRDMVSNMVTSGLVSGMGWVLGAQPASRTGPQH